MPTNSVRERILLAIMTTLQPVAAAHGATLHRSPTVAMKRSQCPALVVFPESEEIAERSNDRVQRELTIRMVALARGVEPESPETDADELLTAAHIALMANRNLGGLAFGIFEQSAEWDVEDADADAVALPARYTIIYRTMAADVSAEG